MSFLPSQPCDHRCDQCCAKSDAASCWHLLRPCRQCRLCPRRRLPNTTLLGFQVHPHPTTTLCWQAVLPGLQHRLLATKYVADNDCAARRLMRQECPTDDLRLSTFQNHQPSRQRWCSQALAKSLRQTRYALRPRNTPRSAHLYR